MMTYTPVDMDDTYYLRATVPCTPTGTAPARTAMAGTTGPDHGMYEVTVPPEPEIRHDHGRGTWTRKGKTLSSMTPVVGAMLTATLTDPDGGVTGETWQWSRSMTMSGTFMDIAGATSMSYTPMAADEDYYLMVKVMYTDGHGSGKMAMATSANAVTTGDPLVVEYDTNRNGTIEKSEVIAAINDYLFPPGGVEIISKADVIRLINMYLFPNG